MLERALDVLFILHADHEQNCSTSAMRGIGSSHVDPYSALAGAAAALYGPLHGGANEAVLRMLKEIGSVGQHPRLHQEGQGRRRPPDGLRPPRLQVVRPARQDHQATADQVFEVTGKNPLLDIALELERIALEDEYFVTRKLYPNVDFYSGLIYQAMGFPVEMFPVLFAIAAHGGLGRAVGRDAARPRAEDRPAPADLHRRRHPRLRLDRRPRLVSLDPTGGPMSVQRLRQHSSALLLILGLGAAGVAAQTATPFDSTRACEHLRDQVAIGPRPAGSAANAKTRAYIISTLAKSGFTAVEQPFDATTPVGPVKMVNLVATLPGERPDRIAIASHFDTKLFREFRFVGANDGGSSTACAARAGARAQGPAERPFTDRAAVPRRRGSRRRVARPEPHLRQPPLRRGRARKTGTLASR